MKKEFKIYGGDMNVSVEVTNEKMEKVFDSILKWCEKYECISGECLCQSDNCNIEAPILLSEIIDDIIQFKTEWIS